MMWTVMTGGLCSSSLSRCTCPTHTWCLCLIGNEIRSYYRCNEGHREPPHHHHSAHPPLEPTRLRAAHMAPTGRRLHRLQECLGRWFAWFGICAINWILGFSCRILRWSVLSIYPLVVLSFHMLGKKLDLNLTTLLLFFFFFCSSPIRSI